MGCGVILYGVDGVYMHAVGKLYAAATAMLMICFHIFFLFLSVERSPGIVLLDMSSLCLFFPFSLESLGFQARGLRACVIVRKQHKKTVQLIITGAMGPGSRIEIHQDRHNSNTHEALKRNYFWPPFLLFLPRTYM